MKRNEVTMESKNGLKPLVDGIFTIWLILFTIILSLSSCNSMRSVRNGEYNLYRPQQKVKTNKTLETETMVSERNVIKLPEEPQKNDIQKENKVVAGDKTQTHSNCNDEDIDFLKLKMAKLEEEISALRQEISNLVMLFAKSQEENLDNLRYKEKTKHKQESKINSKSQLRKSPETTNANLSKANVNNKNRKESRELGEQAKYSFEQSKRIEGIMNLIKEKKYDEALNEIDNAFKETEELGTLSILWYWKGEALFYKRDFAKAIECFQKVVSTPKSKKRTEAQIMIAECYTKLGKLKEAKREYQKFIEEYPFSEYVPRAKRMMQQL